MTYDYAIFSWGPSPENIQFNMENPDPTAEYVLESVTGLGPPPIDVILADKVFEGGTFQGRRPQNREIVMLITLRPLYTAGSKSVAELRRKLYDALTPKLGSIPVFQLLDTSNVLPLATATGYVSNIEPNIFSKDPQLQITMKCDSPYFSFPPFTHATPSSLNGLNPLPITNTGNAPTGIDITVKLTASASLFRLTNSATGKMFQVENAFLTNDIIRINTIVGKRTATLTRGAAVTNLLNMMTLDSDWIQLVGGLNNIVPSTTAYQVTSLKYTFKMWGY